MPGFYLRAVDSALRSQEERSAASTFTHILVALIAGRILFPGPVPVRFWFVAAALSVLPDADAFLHFMGVPYHHLFGHRGFFHSLLFAAAASGAATVLLFPDRRGRVFLFLFAITASHGFLDAMTDGGLGIAFFAPFDETRYFLPWRPLAVAPIGVRAFFSEWGLRVLASELVWVLAPLTVVLIAAAGLRRLANGRRSAEQPRP